MVIFKKDEDKYINCDVNVDRKSLTICCCLAEHVEKIWCVTNNSLSNLSALQ